MLQVKQVDQDNHGLKIAYNTTYGQPTRAMDKRSSWYTNWQATSCNEPFIVEEAFRDSGIDNDFNWLFVVSRLNEYTKHNGFSNIRKCEEYEEMM